VRQAEASEGASHESDYRHQDQPPISLCFISYRPHPGEGAYAAAMPVGYHGRVTDEVKIKGPNNLRSFIAIVLLLFFLAFVYSPDPISETFRGMASEGLEAMFDSVADDAALNRVTPLDKLIAHGGVAVGGAAYWLNAPEASKIIWHYCYGDGSQLVIDPVYIKASPVVLRAIPTLKDGEITIVSFHQDDDYRLSLALNPFKIMAKNTGGFTHYKVWQKVEFEIGKKKGVKTAIRLGRFQVMVRDGFVHALGCKPFEAISEWDG